MGFDQKMKKSKLCFSEADKKALILAEKKLIFETNLIYRRLGQSRSEHQPDPKASDLGHKKGLNLTIRNAVESGFSNLYLPTK